MFPMERHHPAHQAEPSCSRLLVDAHHEHEIVATMRRAARGRTLLAGLTLLAGAAAIGADAESQRVAGTLNMNASLRIVSKIGPCPPGVSVSGACSARTSSGRSQGWDR